MQYAKVVADDDVAAILQQAYEQVRRGKGQRVVSFSLEAAAVDFIQLFAAAQARGDIAVLWQRPAQRIALLGIGAERQFEATGPDRFDDIAKRWRSLMQKAIIVQDESIDPDKISHPGPGPLALGGFAFAPGVAAGVWDGFGDGWLCLPRTVYGMSGGRRWVTVNVVVTPETDVEAVAADIDARLTQATADMAAASTAMVSGVADGPRTANGHIGVHRQTADDVFLVESDRAEPVTQDLQPKEQWMAAVERVADNIRRGRLEKAVMARSVQVPLPAGFSVAPALRHLEKTYPECYVFAVARPCGCFIGATPERIVHRERGKVKVACLAGSTGRGHTDAEDKALGEALLNDPKNVEEHLIVLRAILAALEPVCTDIRAGERPTLRKFANVQHLYTPVTAHTEKHDVLHLVSRVHPTPAIGGHPTEAALQLIAQEEGMDRGWYAGPVGWLNRDGDGEFAAALRSGLLLPKEARLFAGCGIMGDSDPQSEYDESELKLRPMLKALEAGMR